MSILTCPSCGFNYCPIFYGFNLTYPNFDTPKKYKIELKYICTINNDKMQSIDLGQYQKIIELNSTYYTDDLEEKENHNFNIKISNDDEKQKNIPKDINAIINKYNNCIIQNEKEINNYINNEKEITEKTKFILLNYIQLNKQLYFFIKTFLENIDKYRTKNLLESFYYIYKLADYFKDIDDNKKLIQKNMIDEFITKKDMFILPFILKVNKNYIKSTGFELLEGHTLPIVGLTQMRNGLILSGSCGLLKVWKKIDDINNENYNKFQIFRTVSYEHHLIRCFIELEDDIVIFCRGNQLIEALINDKDPYKELFSYQITGNSLESLASLNKNKNFAAGLYTKLYIFERNNKFPILTLQYHRLFIMKMISIPVLNLFCSAGSDNKVIIYNSTNFELYCQFEFEESHIVCLCNYNDKDFCSSTMGGKIWYFKRDDESNSYVRIGPINAHPREIYGILQINTGEVVSASRDGTLKFWNIPKQICTCLIKLNNSETYDHICQLDDGRLSFASCNRTIKIFNNLPFFNNKSPSLL